MIYLNPHDEYNPDTDPTFGERDLGPIQHTPMNALYLRLLARKWSARMAAAKVRRVQAEVKAEVNLHVKESK